MPKGDKGFTVSYLTERGVNRFNEDAYIIGKKTFGVFDGATSLNSFISKEGKTGGLIASRIARYTFKDEKKTLLQAARLANKRIREAMIRKGINPKNKLDLWGTTAAIVRIEGGSFTWLNIGDSSILVVYKDNSYKVLSEDDEHDREMLVLFKNLADKGLRNVKHMPQIEGKTREGRRKTNITHGLMNGEEEMLKFIAKGEENLKDISHILLFTDGLKVPRPDPLENEDYGGLVSVYLKGESRRKGNGIKEARDFIRRIENNDPWCTRYPRLKQHDDITVIDVKFQ